MDRFTLAGTDLTWRALDDEIVVLDLASSAYLALNDTAAILWKRLASPASLDDLVAELTAQFEVDEATARSDAEALLVELLDRGLVAPVAGR